MKVGDRVQIVNLNHDHGKTPPLPETERRLTGQVGTVVRPSIGRRGMYVQLDNEGKGPVIVWPDECELLGEK